jgi:ABC-type sulfate/molybdate transport systems ATPase subunit
MSIDVSLQARAGAFELSAAFTSEAGTTAVLGASGAGKTLLLRAIAGLLKPTSGRVAVDGRVLYDSEAGVSLPVRRRGVGYVFQDYALFPHLTVTENLAFGLRERSRQEAHDAVAHMIELLGLQGLEERRAANLSGGQRQRVALGRALVPGPGLLLLDEPFSALDAPARTALVDEFLSVRSLVDVPTLLVTHDVAEAYALSEHMVVLSEGRVLQSGASEQVYWRPDSPDVARMVGVQNLLPGVVVDVRNAAVEVDVSGMRLVAELRSPGLAVGERVTVGLRAMDVRAEPAAAGGPTNAELVRIVNRGSSISATLRLGGGSTVSAEIGRERDGLGETRETIARVKRVKKVGSGGWTVRAEPGSALLWPER